MLRGWCSPIDAVGLEGSRGPPGYSLFGVGVAIELIPVALCNMPSQSRQRRAILRAASGIPRMPARRSSDGWDKKSAALRGRRVMEFRVIYLPKRKKAVFPVGMDAAGTAPLLLVLVEVSTRLVTAVQGPLADGDTRTP